MTNEIRTLITNARDNAQQALDYLSAALQPDAAAKDLLISAAYCSKGSLRYSAQASTEMFEDIPNRPLYRNTNG